MLISALYVLLFSLSVYALYVLIHKISNKKASFYVVLFTLISVVCIAYFAYSISNNADMALVANQFTYFDGSFILLFFLLCVLDICGMKINKVIGTILFIGCIAVLALAFTTGKTDIFYESVDFETYKGASHLIMHFGPLHNYFLVFVVLNTLAPMGIVVYSLFHKKKISYKYTIALGALEIAIVILYFIQFYFGVGFDLLPCGYVLMEYVILGVLQRIALYDMSQVVADNSEERKEYGYIIFGKDKAYVGASSVAKFYFPELEDLDIDRPVSDEFIKREFVDKLDLNKNELKAVPMIFTREERIIVCSVKPYVRGKKNQIYGYIVELRDDTEQQQMIQTLNRVNKELEDALISANSANNAKSNFLASMSHEIRTPINAILGMNEIALRECEDESLISYMNDIRNAGNNLLFLINDILDFSKIEAGKIEIIEGEYNIAKTIKDVKDLVQIRAVEKSLHLKVEVEPTLPILLRGDENRIRQIILNILNNAVKYTHQGSVALKVSGVNRETSGENKNYELNITVKDTGIGIKKENIPLLFDSFSRVDEKKNKAIEGTGLGLAITKSLVEKMGGNISVDSEYGKGTEFKVRIPQEVVDSSAIGDFESGYDVPNAKKNNDEHIDASNMSILVVDDNKVNLIVAKGLLKATKAFVTVCKSGAECLEIIKKKHFDIIFLDHMMPEMDGIETLHRAKEQEENLCKDSAYIALTANAISGVKEMYLSEGFDDYISKPIDSGELEDIISRYAKE